MSKFSEWFSHLGQKSGRTDIWVVLIAITYLGCISGYLECPATTFNMTLLIGMYTDLGINSVTSIFSSLKSTNGN